jgi:hypothetical protein
LIRRGGPRLTPSGRRRCAATSKLALRVCRTRQAPNQAARFANQKRDHEGPFFDWRRGRDSNPRWAINPYTLSRRAPSTARTPLRKLLFEFGGDPDPATPRRPSSLLPLLPSGPDGVHNVSSRGDRIGSPLKAGYGTRRRAGWVGRPLAVGTLTAGQAAARAPLTRWSSGRG